MFSWPAYRAFYCDLLRQLPPAVACTFLVHASAGPRLDELRRDAGVGREATVLEVPDELAFSVWSEDMYVVVHDGAGGRELVEPTSIRRADDQAVTGMTADGVGLARRSCDLYFEGGNMLVGDDFWLLGADHVRHNAKRALAAGGRPGLPPDELVRHLFRQLEGTRQLHFVGSALPVPAQAARPIVVDGEEWTEVTAAGNRPGTVQPIFHVDMFVTLAGRDDDGRPVVVVGDPRAACAVLGDELRPEALAPVFDDVADRLVGDGFAVRRTPLPLLHVDDHERRRRKWYFASYNNALVEIAGATRRVWLPSYGHGRWAPLAAADVASRQVWEDLGFEVAMLADCHPLAADLGGPHCITKCVARRGEGDGPP